MPATGERKFDAALEEEARLDKLEFEEASPLREKLLRSELELGRSASGWRSAEIKEAAEEAAACAASAKVALTCVHSCGGCPKPVPDASQLM